MHRRNLHIASRFALLSFLVVALSVPQPAGASRAPRFAATGTITGRITDAQTGIGVSGVIVRLDNTRIGALSARDGQYRITDVPVGVYTLTLRRLGYTTGNGAVTVLADTSVTVNLTLAPLPTRLQEIVTTATGGQARRELGNVVATIDAAQLMSEEPITSVQDLLTARAAGVDVIQNSGTLGQGARIRIRGISSMTLPSDPLVYIDGVRIQAENPEMSPGADIAGSVRPSFINDLNPDDIEKMEVVKGPAASTLYGTQAANGVIVITTKRGRAGPSRWNIVAEQGVTADPGHYPGQYFNVGTSAADGSSVDCLQYQAVEGACTISRRLSRNLLDDASTTPFTIGYRQDYSGQVAGGNQATRYFLSASLEDERAPLKMPNAEATFLEQQRGVASLPGDQLDPSALRRGTLRANLSTKLNADADVSVSMGYTTDNNRLPQVGDNNQGVLDAAIFGTADPASAADPWGLGGAVIARPAEGFSNTTVRTVDRFTTSATASWRPLSHVTTRAIVGLDNLAYTDQATVLNGQGCSICVLLVPEDSGLRTLNKYTEQNYTVDLNATGLYPRFWRKLGSRTAVGVQYTRDLLEGLLTLAQDLSPATVTLNAGALRSSAESTTDYKTLGMYIEEQLSWGERLYLTGALRRDENSSFGSDFAAAYYPKVAASWVLRESNAGALWNGLRLRAALGESGQQPGANAAITYFTPTVVAVGTGDASGVTVGGQGNPELKPERSRELEGGFETSFFHDRLGFDVTLYDKRTTGALADRTLPGSLGVAPTEVENVGVVSNRGIELGIDARVIDAKAAQWDVSLQGSGNRNRLVALTPGVPALTGFGYQDRPGYPLFGNWWAGRLASYQDANHNGVIEPNEVVLVDTATYLGSSVPVRQASIGNTLTLFRRTLRLFVLLDYRGGFSSLNGSYWIPCLVGTCQALHDANVPLGQQARAVAVFSQSAFAPMVEDASFASLREVSIGYTLPHQFAAKIGARNAELVVTGRNLALLTGYHGWDPEVLQNTVNAFQQYTADGGYNLGQLSMPRVLLVRLNLAF